MNYQVRCKKKIYNYRKGKLYDVRWSDWTNDWYFNSDYGHRRMSNLLFKEHFEFVGSEILQRSIGSIVENAKVDITTEPSIKRLNTRLGGIT